MVGLERRLTLSSGECSYCCYLLLPGRLLPKLQPLELPASTAPKESTKDHLLGGGFNPKFAKMQRSQMSLSVIVANEELSWLRQPQQTNSRAAKTYLKDRRTLQRPGNRWRHSFNRRQCRPTKSSDGHFVECSA